MTLQSFRSIPPQCGYDLKVGTSHVNVSYLNYIVVYAHPLTNQIGRWPYEGDSIETAIEMFRDVREKKRKMVHCLPYVYVFVDCRQ